MFGRQPARSSASVASLENHDTFLVQPNLRIRKPAGIIRQRLLGSRVYKL
jgi:hypothetical protein